MTIFERICDAQGKWIAYTCGRDAADRANYGWGQRGKGRMQVIETKVYGYGILTSKVVRGAVIHDWAAL